MVERLAGRLGLRLRVFLFFALIGLGAVAAVAVAMVLAAGRLGGDAGSVLTLHGGVAAFAIAGLTLWVWQKFDDNVARPIQALVRDARAATHAGGACATDAARARYLDDLAPAVAGALEALGAARGETGAAVARATAEGARQKAWLEAVLRDLEQGVVICGLDHTLLLYNHRAREVLRTEALGLGRPFLDCVAPQPFHHALRRLHNRFAAGRHLTHPDRLSVTLAATTGTGNRALKGRLSLMLRDEVLVGYVVVFEDVSDELAAGIWRERAAQEAIEDLRVGVTALILADALADGADMPNAARRALRDWPEAMRERLGRLDAAASDLLASAWPVMTVLSATLLDCLAARRSEGRDLAFEIVGPSCWLVCDSAAVTDLLDRLLNRVAVYAGVERFALRVEGQGDTARVEARWRGDPVPVAVLDAWVEERLDVGIGAFRGRDVLDRHKTEVWSERCDDGARLCLPLSVAADREAPPPPARARPEFYDFDLLGRAAAGGDAATRLKRLAYVVFDTETTGLEPAKDRIVSLAGVRIVNGRLLQGEVFSTLVDPGRPIPAASSRVHGITDKMVEGAPKIEAVLPNFAAFVGDAVLVAHNAAFDMKFLAMQEARAGVRFGNPVLDTVLLAAHALGADDDLTLDALARRFAVTLPDKERHTALGDALATAKVLLALLNLLEAQGVTTLGEALEVSKKQTAIRRRQAKY